MCALFNSCQMATAAPCSVPCQICSNPTATYHCNTCGDVLCDICKAGHLRSNATKNHHLVPFAEKLDPNMIAGISCHTHQFTAEFWCDEDGVQICKSCVTEEHKGHQISDIETKLSEQREKMEGEISVLHNVTKPKWEDALKQARGITACYRDDINKIDKELKSSAGKIHMQVDSILDKRRRSLQKMTASNLNKLQEQEKNLAEGLQTMEDDIQRYKDERTEGDPNILLQFTPGSIQNEGQEPPPILDKDSTLLFHEGQCDIQALEAMVGQMTFQDSNQIVMAANTLTLNAAQVRVVQYTKQPDPLSVSRNSDARRSLSLNPQEESKFNVKYYSPLIACTGSGLAWVQSGKQTIQLVDRNGSEKDTIDLDFKLRGITIDHNGRLLLLDETNKCVKSVSDDKTITTIFCTEWKPSAFCCLQSGDIVVVFGKCKQVLKYSSTGEVLKRYDGTNVYESTNVRCLCNVAASKNSQDFYLVDHDIDGHEERLFAEGYPGKLLAFDKDCQFLFKYSGHDNAKFTLMGVCADQFGHVLITDMNYRKVHILHKDGKFMRCIKTEGMGGPCTIDVDDDGFAWVGFEQQDPESYVKVYRYLQ